MCCSELDSPILFHLCSETDQQVGVLLMSSTMPETNEDTADGAGSVPNQGVGPKLANKSRRIEAENKVSKQREYKEKAEAGHT